MMELSYGAMDQSWVINSFLALFSIFIIYLMGYIISSILQSEKMKRFVISELYDAGATVLMIVFLTFMINGLSDYITTYYFKDNILQCGTKTVDLGKPSGNPTEQMNNVLDFFKCRMLTYANTLYEIQSSSMGTASKYYKLLWMYISLIGLPVFQGTYVSSWYVSYEKARVLVVSAASLIPYLDALSIVIDYIKANMLTVFLPIGIVLRAFRVTRGLGAFFISLAIATYFIFPWTYMIIDPSYVKPSIPKAPVVDSSVSCYPTMSGIVRDLSPSWSKNTLETDVDLESIKNSYSKIYTRVLLHPFIAAVVSLIFVKYGTNLLGGESEEISMLAAKLL